MVVPALNEERRRQRRRRRRRRNRLEGVERRRNRNDRRNGVIPPRVQERIREQLRPVNGNDGVIAPVAPQLPPPPPVGGDADAPLPPQAPVQEPSPPAPVPKPDSSRGIYDFLWAYFVDGISDPERGMYSRIETGALNVLLQVKPKIPASILTSDNFSARKLSSNDEEYRRVKLFFTVGCERSHKIKEILKIERRNDPERNVNGQPLPVGSWRMLWHGTRAKNVGNILEEGLKAGGAYPRSVYFADRTEQSIIYTRNWSESEAYLFLSEVKYPIKLINGTSVPDPAGNVVVDDCEWAMGATVDTGRRVFAGVSFKLYSEFIAFRPEDQIRMKYLVKFKTTWGF